MTSKIDRAYTIAERIYLFLLGVYLLYLAQENTMYFLLLPGPTEKVLFFVLAFAACGKLILLYLTNRENLKGLMRIVIPAFFCAVVYALVYWTDRYNFLLFLGVLTVGCIGSDYRRVCKVYLMTIALAVLVAILCALGGGISNSVYLKDGEYVRSSWGIIYPTDLASYLLYIVAIWWCLDREAPDLLFLLPLSGVFLVAWFVSRSDTSVYSSALFAVFILLHFLIRRFHLQVLQKIIDRLAPAVFPVFAVMMMLLTWAYGKGNAFAYRVNDWMTHRLQLGWDAWQNYGIHLFGHPFDMNGATVYQQTNYTFVDCSYIMILVRYGAVTLLMIGLLWILMTRKAVRLQNRRLVFVLVLIAFHSLSEHHLTEINYNILLVLPFALLGQQVIRVPQAEKGRMHRWSFLRCESRPVHGRGMLGRCGIWALLSLLFVLAMPGFFSWTRTLFTLTSLTATVTGRRMLYVGAMLGGVCVALFLVAVDRIICAFLTREKPERISLLFVGLFILAVAGGLWRANGIIAKGMEERRSLIEEDREAIELIKSVEGAKLYEAGEDELYRRLYGDIRTSLFSGEELSRYYDVSVITDAALDSPIFFGRGFLYGRISEKHALYTNSQEVIQKLTEAGYHFTGYFSYEHAMDMEEAAARNGLAYEDGQVMMEGIENPLGIGPFVNLRSGQYTIAFDLYGDPQALAQNANEDGEIGLLRITSDIGENTIRENPLYASQFDESGHYEAKVTGYIGDSLYVEFKVFPYGDARMGVKSVTCKKTPEYDTHPFYDRKHVRYREEYFDLEGNPYYVSGWLAAQEFAYDSDKNITTYRYFDADNTPILNPNGFSVLKRDYNKKKQIKREAYYGTDGEPILRYEGYAATDREYDEKGNLTVQRFYDTQDQLTITTSKYAVLERTFDENAKIIQEAYYGTDEKLLTQTAGHAYVTYAYDENGNQTQVRYYNVDGDLVLVWNSNAGSDKWFDEQNHLIREVYIGTDGQEYVRGEGFSSYTVAYDERGWAVDYRYYDPEGNEVMRTENFSSYTVSYDDAGNQIAFCYYDPQGNKVMRNEGYAEIRREYDGSKRLIREAYFDVNGEPVALPDGQSSVAYEYDAAGNRYINRYYGPEGEPVMIWGSYFESRRTYNEKKQAVREEYLGIDEKPIITGSGYATVEREYDAAGNQTVQRFYDTEDNLTLHNDGYAEVVKEYDESGRALRENYYDTEGNPVNIGAGYATIERAYDVKGALEYEKFFDTEGNEVVRE